MIHPVSKNFCRVTIIATTQTVLQALATRSITIIRMHPPRIQCSRSQLYTRGFTHYNYDGLAFRN